MKFLRDPIKLKYVLVFGLSAVVVAVSAFNATLAFDDLYLVGYFKNLNSSLSGWSLVRHILLNLDLAPHEYRLYGLSRLIHFSLWKAFGIHAVPYAIFIVVTQIASGYGIARLLVRVGADELQAGLAWAVWVFSVFLVTFCFHYYSYEILPYQITILCALTLRYRVVSFFLGTAIALTGEAHLIASCLLLFLVAVTAESRSKQQRIVDAGVPIAAVVCAVIAHRLTWLFIVGHQSGPTRFTFAAPTTLEFLVRVRIWLGTLLPGMTDQIIELLKFSGAGSILVVVIIVAGAAAAKRSWPGGSVRPAIGIAVICVASFGVLFAHSMLTGLISPWLPRRYGYVPNTLCVMTLVIALLTPRVRAVFGIGPAVVAFSVSLSFWMLLQFVALPGVRSQDQHVWNVVKLNLTAKGPGANLLLISDAFLDVTRRPIIEDLNSVAFRPGVSEIFESAFQGYWWEAQHAIVFSAANFSAYRWENVDADHVKLFGNGVNGLPPRIVPTSSIVVLYDQRKNPYSANDPRGVTTFNHWQEFKEVIAAKGLF